MSPFISRLITISNHRSIRLLIAIGLLSLVFNSLDNVAIWESIKHFDPAIGSLMLAIHALLVCLFAKRWHLIGDRLDIKAPYSQFFRAIWISGFISQFGPPLVFGEITRFKLIQGYANNWHIVMSQILDRVSGQIVLIGLVILSMPIYIDIFTLSLTKRLIFIVAMALIVFVVAYTITQRFLHLTENEQEILISILNPFKLLSHYAVSFAIQGLLMLNFVLAAIGLNSLDHPGIFILLIPLVLSAVTFLPISFADWGTREATALMILSATDMGAEEIVSISIVYGAFNFLGSLPGALLIAIPGAAVGRQ